MEMNILDINRKVIFVFSSNTYANIFLKEMLSFFFLIYGVLFFCVDFSSNLFVLQAKKKKSKKNS